MKYKTFPPLPLKIPTDAQEHWFAAMELAGLHRFLVFARVADVMEVQLTCFGENIAEATTVANWKLAAIFRGYSPEIEILHVI